MMTVQSPLAARKLLKIRRCEKCGLVESIKLVRDFLTPNWDIHPEMVTHTWIINTKTGRPYPERSERFMENWGWSQDKSVDELADAGGHRNNTENRGQKTEDREQII